MTTPTHSTITLTEPGDLLAAVPHLLGFHPENSLVVITVHGIPGAGGLGITARIDLPGEGECARVAQQLATGPIAQDAPDGVILVVVGGHPAGHTEHARQTDGPPVPHQRRAGSEHGTPVLPHASLVRALHSALGDAGVPVVLAAWTSEIVASNTWYTYREGGTGAIPDPRSSPLAAAMAASGSVTFRNRAELAELLARESVENLARRSARLTTMLERSGGDAGGREAWSNGIGRRALQAVLGAVARTAAGSALTEEDLLEVLAALSDHRIRDMALSTALTDQAACAEQLWLTLVRKAPDPERAEAAALLAFSAYLRGDGALAAVALECVEASRPEHRLGALLRRALDAGVNPSALAVVAEDVAEDARILLDEDGRE